MAPEVLRDEQTYFRGTQKGDVYAFAIILHEISMRQGPFYLGETSLIEPKGKKSNSECYLLDLHEIIKPQDLDWCNLG